MHQIRPADGLFDAFGIAVGIGEATGLDDGLKDRELEFLQGKVGVLAGLGEVASRQDADILAGCLQFMYRPPRRGRQSVSPNIIVVDNKKYLHTYKIIYKDTIYF